MPESKTSPRLIKATKRMPDSIRKTAAVELRKTGKNLRKMGRPSKFKPEFVKQAFKLCQMGATDLELADFFGVEKKTIYNWAAEHKEFLHSIKIGKDAADDRVVKSLYHRAIGYSVDSVKIFNYQGVTIEHPYREHYPPDTAALIFWLKNRRRLEWRDKQDLDLHHFEHPLPDLSDEGLVAIVQASNERKNNEINR